MTRTCCRQECRQSQTTFDLFYKQRDLGEANRFTYYISLKISKTIGIISRLRYVLPTSILLHIYRSLIHPYISYGLSVWGQTSKLNLEKILILQKRALRLIYFRNNREHAIPLFVCSNILPVDMLYFKSIASLMHDINNQSAPLNLIYLFDRVDSVHSYRTRSANFI